jgi:hypothetical protein
MKKKIIILALFLIISTILVSNVFAGIDVTHKCIDFRCVEGTDVTFEFFVDNNIEESIIIDRFMVVERDTLEVIAFYNEKYVLPPGSEIEINITLPIKMPLEGYTYFYNPCIIVSSIDDFDNNIPGQYVCGDITKTLTVTPRERVECIQDSDCKEGMYCSKNYSCLFLDCKDDEAIVGNKCMKLVCNNFEIAKDHICQKKSILKSPILIWIGLLVLVLIILAYIIFVSKSNPKPKSDALKRKKDKDSVKKRRRK